MADQLHFGLNRDGEPEREARSIGSIISEMREIAALRAFCVMG